MAYPLGTGVSLQATFQDQLGDMRDPTTVILYVRQPKQAVATQYTGVQLTQVSTGLFSFSLYLDIPGTWLYCWKGTGVVEAATFDIPIVVQNSSLRTT